MNVNHDLSKSNAVGTPHLDKKQDYLPHVLALIGLATTWSLLRTEWNGVTITPERILIPFGFGLTVLVAAIRPRLSKITGSAVFFVAFLFIIVVSTLLSAELGDVGSRLLQVLVPMAAYVIFSHPQAADTIVKPRTLERFAILMGLLGIVNVALLAALGPPGWFGASDSATLVRARALTFEPNLYGAIMAATALGVLSCYRGKSLRSRMAVFFAHAGLLMSLSRGPWIAYGVGLAILLWLNYLANNRRIVRLTRRILVAIAILVGGLVWAFRETLLGKSTILVRSTNLRAAFDDFLHRPLLGWGADTLGRLHPELNSQIGISSEANAWTTSLPVAILHDYGILGFIAFSLLIGWIAFRLIVKHQINADPVLCGTLGALAATLIASLATTAHTTGFFWMVIGLASAQAAPRASRDTALTGSLPTRFLTMAAGQRHNEGT